MINSEKVSLRESKKLFPTVDLFRPPKLNTPHNQLYPRYGEKDTRTAAGERWR